MANFDIDLSGLSNLQNPTYKLRDVQHKLIRRAADLVQFRDAPKDELWEITADADGEYIVARYSEEPEGQVKEASLRSPWEATVSGTDVSLFYKGAYFTRFTHPDAATVSSFLPAKLASDRTFLDSLLSSLSPDRQKEIRNLYPELI